MDIRNLENQILEDIFYKKYIIYKNKYLSIKQLGGVNRIFTWKDKINEWKKGNYQTYNKGEFRDKFYYLTSFCSSSLTEPYKEVYIPSTELNSVKYDTNTYNEYFTHKTQRFLDYNDNVCVIKSNTGTTLIIPMIKYGKEFTTIKDFMDNADEEQQKVFWATVANQISIFFHNNPESHLYINTHGHDVGYFHLRFDKSYRYHSEENIRQIMDKHETYINSTKRCNK